MIHAIHFHRLILDEAHSIKVRPTTSLRIEIWWLTYISNARQVSLVHALPWRPPISGAYPVRPYKIGSENSSLFYASSKSGLSHVTSARCASARSCNGLKMQRKGAPVVSTGMVLFPEANVKRSNCQFSGFSHVSVFNQEILNPSKLRGDDYCWRLPNTS